MLSDRDYMRSGNHWQPWSRQQASVIKPLIWANVVVFVLTSRVFAGLFGGGGGGEMHINALQELLQLQPYYIRSGQIWRLGTYMFLHANLMHIFFNMWGLYLFGGVVESRLGPARFLRLYFISGIVGGGAWLVANWNGSGVYQIAQGAMTQWVEGTPAAIAGEVASNHAQVLHALGGVIGASGAVFGIMMAAAMTAPEMRIMLLFPPIPMKLRTFVAVYGGIEVVLAWNSATGGAPSRIAHLAHLGGIAGAFIYMKRLGFRSPWDLARGVFAGWRFRRTVRHFRKVHRQPTESFGPTASEIDRILDKIGRTGMGSLTEKERQTLLNAGERFKKH